MFDALDPRDDTRDRERGDDGIRDRHDQWLEFGRDLEESRDREDLQAAILKSSRAARRSIRRVRLKPDAPTITQKNVSMTGTEFQVFFKIRGKSRRSTIRIAIVKRHLN